MDNSTAAALIDDFHALIPGLPNAPRHEVFRRLRQQFECLPEQQDALLLVTGRAQLLGLRNQRERVLRFGRRLLRHGHGRAQPPQRTHWKQLGHGLSRNGCRMLGGAGTSGQRPKS